MALFSGQSGSISFNSVTVAVESWSGTVETEILDTTNTGSSGAQANIAGIQKATVSFKAFSDSAAPMGGFTTGTSAAFVGTIGSSAKTLAFTGRLKSLKIDNPAKGSVSYEGEIESNGAITMPA